jgi:hypothetical protein
VEVRVKKCRARTLRELLLACSSLLAFGGVASAQVVEPDSTINPVTGGDCSVTVVVGKGLAVGTEIDLSLNGMWMGRQNVASRPQMVFALTGPLAHLDRLQIREVGVMRVTGWGASIDVQPAKPGEVPKCQPKSQRSAPDDQRGGLWASFYAGTAVDTFAPQIVGGYDYDYANPGAGGTAAMERVIGGIDFEFRTIGSASNDRQLWIVGQTMYGVRSSEVDCTNSEKRPAVCQSIREDFKDQGINLTDKFIYALEHATSFEAYVSPRFELWTLQRGTIFPAKLYVTARLGVLMLDDTTHDAYEAFHFGGGILAHSGPFDGSFIEVGFGRSDMFFTPPDHTKWRRWKIDGLFSVPAFGKGDKRPRLFLQLYSDFDPRDIAADSIQTFFGIDVPLSELFR